MIGVFGLLVEAVELHRPRRVVGVGGHSVIEAALDDWPRVTLQCFADQREILGQGTDIGRPRRRYVPGTAPTAVTRFQAETGRAGSQYPIASGLIMSQESARVAQAWFQGLNPYPSCTGASRAIST